MESVRVERLVIAYGRVSRRFLQGGPTIYGVQRVVEALLFAHYRTKNQKKWTKG